MKRDKSDKPDSFEDWVQEHGIILMPLDEASSAGTRVKTLPAVVLSPDSAADEAYYTEMTSYTQSGVDARQLRSLRRRPPENKLDLHGLSVAEAYDELALFLTHVLTHGLRVVEIVHGRGHHSTDGRRGILRAKVRQWCCQSPVVLAYNEMPNNPGALIVLLKKNG